MNIDDTHNHPEDLEQVAKVLDALAEQFRTFAENIKEERGDVK
jgi:hypothetical protein